MATFSLRGGGVKITVAQNKPVFFSPPNLVSDDSSISQFNTRAMRKGALKTCSSASELLNCCSCDVRGTFIRELFTVLSSVVSCDRHSFSEVLKSHRL